MSERTWTDRSTSLGYQVNYLARLMGALLHREIVGHGVVPGQFAQLLALYDRDGQTAGELARSVGIERGTMTKTVQRMERDGLVERREDPRDRRAVTIHLTDRSRHLEPDLKEAAARVNAEVTARLTDRQSHALMRGLDVLIAEASSLLAPTSS